MSKISDARHAGYNMGVAAERDAWAKMFWVDVMKEAKKVQKKDYELIAGALKATRPNVEANKKYSSAYKQWIKMVNAVIAVLQEDNKAFDQMKFMVACGAVHGESMKKFVKLAGVLK